MNEPTDVIKSTLPRKENHELAEDLLARFPGVDRVELLKDLIAYYFFEMRQQTRGTRRVRLPERSPAAGDTKRREASTDSEVEITGMGKNKSISRLQMR